MLYTLAVSRHCVCEVRYNNLCKCPSTVIEVGGQRYLVRSQQLRLGESF